MSVEIFENNEITHTRLVKLYNNAFPPVERRPIEKLNHMLKNDKNYHLYVVKVNNSIIGFALIYELLDEKIALLDYMVIDNLFQRKGIGTKLLQYCIDNTKSKNIFFGLLLEIQIDNVNDHNEQKIRQDRIRFYKKFGAKIFENVEYYIPPQSGNIPEKMYLMIIPFTPLDVFSGKCLENIVKKLHLRIYDSTRNDLIEKTIDSLSDTVKLI